MYLNFKVSPARLTQLFDLVNIVVETAACRIAVDVHKGGRVHGAGFVANATGEQALVQVVGIVNRQHRNVRLELLDLRAQIVSSVITQCVCVSSHRIVINDQSQHLHTTSIYVPLNVPCTWRSTPAVANLCTT